MSDGDVTDGIGALGAPLFWTTAGDFAGALSVAGLAEELTIGATSWSKCSWPPRRRCRPPSPDRARLLPGLSSGL